MPISKTENALVLAAKNGNTKCFEELYKLYYDKIYALAMTILKNSADAEDVLQITFVKAWQSIGKLENVSAFNTWIQRITANQCNSMLRGKKQSYSIDDESEDGELLQIESDIMLPEQYAERDDLSLRLKEIIDDLSVVQKETILLYYYNELSVEEIAETMDCSVGTVKSRLFLARKAVKTEIEEKEKKSGEKFYGVAFIPFASLFIKQIKNYAISSSKAADIYSDISHTLFNTPIKITNTPQTSEGPVHPHNNGNVYNTESPVCPANTPLKSAIGSTSKVADSVAKTAFPLWAKVVSIITAVCLLTGGCIFVWNILKPNPTNPIVNAKPGDVFTYGKYEQDNNLDNGAEDIEWRVLDRHNDKLFVVSKYALDCIEYNANRNPDSWKDTDLRGWLNSDFYKKSFTKDEQKNISTTYIYSDEGSTLGLKDTVVTDKVFILNDYEQDTYFSSNKDRIAIATDYAIANGVKANKKKQAIWWLRSHCFENYIGAVYENGYADGEKGGKYNDKFAVRPAMWIDTKAMAENSKAQELVQPVTTKYLTESLRTFLCTFALQFYDKTYDNRNITEDSNILYGVIGERECVDYSLYSEELAKQNETDNWMLTEDNPSPIQTINEKSSVYKALDSDKVDSILKNMFNCTDKDITKMRGWQNPNNPYGYYEGKYYCATGGNGSLENNFEYKDCTYKDGYYYFTLTYYPEGYDNEYVETNTETIYIKTKLLAHEGRPWWSLYYYSTISYEDKSSNLNDDKEDGVKVENTKKDELATEYYKMFAGEYTFTSGMGSWSTQLKIKDDGTFTGKYHDTNMGDSGDGYDATLYLSEFSGNLSNAQKINDYTYSFKLSDIKYKNTPNTEEITDPYGNGTKMLVKYSDAYGLNNTKTIYAYTESAPVLKLPKGFLSWVEQLRSDDTKNNSNLSYKCLYAVEPKYGWIGE